MQDHLFWYNCNMFLKFSLFHKGVLEQPAPACQPLHAFPESHEGEAQEETQDSSELSH